VKQCLIAAGGDIIKIKEDNRSRACIFFEETGNQCGIYENRPEECRALKCWDTREIEAIYSKNRLSREELVSQIEGLWDIVVDHQSRCDYRKISTLVDRMDRTGMKNPLNRISYMIKYDMQLRSLIVKKGALDPEMVDFLLGRPLFETISRFGLQVKKKGKAYELDPSDFLMKKIKSR
jgi:hypothetical protein